MSKEKISEIRLECLYIAFELFRMERLERIKTPSDILVFAEKAAEWIFN